MSQPHQATQGAALSRAWRDHFTGNQSKAEELPWDDGYRLTCGERTAIETSVQQFQLGERAEGRRLLACGRAYGLAAGDPYFAEALALFVKEEQRHSRHLLRFMQAQGIPAVESHWVDDVFRRVRVLAGLELELRVLVTAEIIAVPYYRALHGATASKLLRSICESILEDEAAHLRFQKTMLSRLGARRAPGLRCLIWLAHRLFLIGTCCVVWVEHRKVFKSAGYSFGRVLEEALIEMSGLESPSPDRISEFAADRSRTAVPDF
jgi:hypothetical protein